LHESQSIKALICVCVLVTDAGHMESFPFGLLNQTNQNPVTKLTGNKLGADPYKNQTILFSGTLDIPEEAVLLFKGLMVTRVMPSFYILVVLISSGG